MDEREALEYENDNETAIRSVLRRHIVVTMEKHIPTIHRHL
jgi:hypothetical protein